MYPTLRPTTCSNSPGLCPGRVRSQAKQHRKQFTTKRIGIISASKIDVNKFSNISICSWCCLNPVQLFIRFSNKCFNSCLNNCFLFEKRAREACPRDPPVLWLVRCLHLVGHLFPERLFDPFVSLTVLSLTKVAPKLEPKYGLREPIFQKTCKNGKVCLDCAGVYGLHMSPIPWSAQGDPQNEEKSESISEGFFWGSKYENMWKHGSKMSPKRWLYFRGEPLGALLAHLWCSKSFLTQKVKPKSSKNVPNGPQVTPKGSQNHDNWLEMVQDST